MYAYICETGARFFEGVRTPSNATVHSRDPPPPRKTKEPESHCQGSGPKWITPHATVSGPLAWGRGKPSPAQCQNTARKPPTHHAQRHTHALKTSRAGALFVGTRSWSNHDHAINSSTSWS